MSRQPKKSTNVRPERPRSKNGEAPLPVRAVRRAIGVLDVVAPPLAAVAAERLFTTARRHPRPAWEEDTLATARRTRVPYDGAWLPVWTWGPDEAPAVLLVHGLESRGSQLSAFVEPLVELGLRVVAFDAPGHGDAPMRRASLVEHARGIVTVARHAGDVRLVLAHSMGGAAALLATRFGLRADAFALVAPPTSPLPWMDGFQRMLGLSDGLRAALTKRIEDRYDLPFSELDACADVARLDGPLLVIHDEEDRDVPIARGRELAAAAHDARFVATRGLGHRRILRAPQVLREVEAFAAAFAVPHALASSGERHALADRTASFARTLDAELFFRESRWAS